MKKLTTEEFIKKAREVHGDKYDYSKVEYVNKKTKVIIICPVHGDFPQSPVNHIRGNGCPKCAKINAVKKITIWTYDACFEEAKKYSYRGDFEKGSPRAYSVARTNNWLKNFEWLTTINKPLGYWTKERVFEEARKYTKKHLFSKGCRGAYGAAERNDWLKEMTWFEQPSPNKPRVWSKEAVFALAEQFETKTEFREANKGAYNVAWKNGWLEEMDWLDTSVREPYTKEEVLTIARQYTTKIDFRKAIPNVYNCAQKKGWLEEMTWFVTARKYDRHSYCIYVYTDEDNKVAYVGLTVDKKRRHYNHSTGYDKGGKVTKSPVYQYFQSIDKPVPNPTYLEERLTASEAREKEHDWLVKYQGMGYMLLNKGKTGAGIGSLGSAAIKWTKPKVFEEARKYQSRSEFDAKCAGAYTVATKRGWIEQMSWMKEKWSHPTPKWTKETVFEESKKYSTRREFEENASSAYSKALQHSWLDEMTWLVLKRKSWTKEEVFDESKKYNSRAAFSKGAPGAYGIARREKWLDEMPWLVVRTTYDSMKDSIFDEARKYYSIEEFKKGNPDFYAIALKKRWLKEMIWLDPVRRLQLTKEEVFNLSKHYKSKASFYKGNRDVYYYAKKNGWLDEMTWFITPHGKWTKEEVFEESRKYSSRKDFENGSRGAYNAARTNKWLDEMPWLVRIHHDIWTKEEIFEESKKYSSRKKFSEGNGTAYGIARRKKWLDEMPWLVLTPIKWTRDTVFEESHRYKSRGEFQKKGRGAYAVAQKNKWLDEMTWLKPKLKIWNKEKVIEEAMKYSTKVMFHNKSSVAYRVALRNKWMDEIAEIVGWK